MEQPLDRGTISASLDTFGHAWTERIAGWRRDNQGHTEKRYAQQYWSDLLRCFGIIPERIDLFERGAARASTGGAGYIDFFWSGVAIGEAKSLDHDLTRAHEQALDYLAGGSVGQHEWPKYVLVTDFARLRIERLGDAPWSTEFSVGQIADHVDELMFLAGREAVTKAEEEVASIQAADLMAGMFQALVGDDVDIPVGDEAPQDADEEDFRAQEASILLTRLLFLLYGDDAGLWEADLFHRWVEYDTTADNLGPQLDALFRNVLNVDPRRRRGVPESMERFPYVNGGIFDGRASAGFLTPGFRDALLEACRFRWTAISPAVFGAMFQLVKSKQARRGDGEHYTSEENILKTIGPLFLDDYRARADRLIQNKTTKRSDLLALIEEMAANIYLDPACGAGNFLNVAYGALRDIETDLLLDMHRRAGSTMNLSLDATLEQRLTIDRFYGFEINWWPAKIAETAMFLVDHQANRRLAAALGQAPDRLPITITATIIHHDALSLDWAEALPTTPGQTYVFGNPPFLGDTSRNKGQLAQMQAAWGGDKQLSRLDYVTAWHALTLRLLADRAGEWAFVTTNSIVQGDQASRLFEPIFTAGWRIKFAHRAFRWDSDAPGKAAVHCVIIGFTRDAEVHPRLFNYERPSSPPIEQSNVRRINAYLVDGVNVLVTKHSRPLSPELNMPRYGSKPTDGGNLLVSVEDIDAVRADPIAAKYLRPYVGARELLHNEDRWCLWLVDATGQEIQTSPVLRERVDAVRRLRAQSSAASTREYRHHHLFRQVDAMEGDFVCIPIHVSEDRPYFPVKLLPGGVIASNATFQCADPDGFQFAVLSSSMFLTWQKTI
ncbi:DNA methyltransferase [Micrococcus luteus]|nr:DNA methyltransferase [Micrococcus luteus]MCV7613635.1 GcrY protein [Micrococcus luteus]TWH36050.1 hypothetical protein L597_004600000070 [Micrococcus luteus J28]